MTEPVDAADPLTTMARALAHDVSNLVGVILNCASLLEGRGVDGERRLIEGAAQQIADLIGTLRQFTGSVNATPEPVSLNAFLASGVERLTAAVGQGRRLRLDLSTCEMSIDIDPSHLDAILHALLRNAGEASAEDGVVTVFTRKAQGHEGERAECAVLGVRDEGSGMVPSTLARAVEPFFTTKYRRIGTGMGLSIAHGLVACNGGELSVRSAPGEGTEVLMSFPRTKP